MALDATMSKKLYVKNPSKTPPFHKFHERFTPTPGLAPQEMQPKPTIQPDVDSLDRSLVLVLSARVQNM